MAETTSVFKTELIIEDVAEQREGMQLAEQHFLQGGLVQGLAELCLLDQQSSGIHLLEESFEDV